MHCMLLYLFYHFLHTFIALLLTLVRYSARKLLPKASNLGYDP
jgi:hypothetical protein